jgi:cytoskeleton protein RodZ
MKKEQTTGPDVVDNPLEPFPDYTDIRASKGIDLKRVCRSTRIRISYLEAIEKGQFERLPEAIYAETFIKTYAREVGVDPDLILSHYRQYLKKVAVPPEQEKVAPPRPKAPKPVKPAPNLKAPLKAVGWIIALLVIVGFLISFFSTYITDYKKPELVRPSLELKSPAPVASPDQGKAPEQGAVPAATAPATPVTPAKTSYKLAIEASQTTWLNIVEDDSPPYEVMLRPGERIQREATAKFSIDIGNAGGVSVYFQGKALGTLGRSGQVVHLNLPDEIRD